MTLQEFLGIDLPIIQAPMAGVQGSALAIAVSNAGGLGSLPCAMLSLDALRKELTTITEQTSKPFNVNFFCHAQPVPNAEQEAIWRRALSPYFTEYGIDSSAIPTGPGRLPFSEDAATVLAEFRPAVVSFHFGLPSEALLLVVSVASTGQGAQDPPFRLPDSVQMFSDIVYDQPGAGALRLDLFSPKQGNGPFPGAVFIACGGWTGGSKSQFWRQSAYLAERGFVAITTQCRPAPAFRFPTQLNDAVAAVRWLRSHAREYKVEPTRIAVGGGSSGGHLAALVSTNSWSGSDWSGAPPDYQVQAAVLFNAVLDAPSFATPSVVQTNLTTFLGVPFAKDSTLWREASPLSHVSPRAAPTLLLHGTTDQTVPYSQSVDMQRRLREAGLQAELFSAEGATHGFFNRPPWYEPTVAKTAEFLGTVFQSRPR